MLDRALNTPEIKKTWLRGSHVSNYISRFWSHYKNSKKLWRPLSVQARKQSASQSIDKGTNQNFYLQYFKKSVNEKTAHRILSLIARVRQVRDRLNLTSNSSEHLINFPLKLSGTLSFSNDKGAQKLTNLVNPLTTNKTTKS